MHTPAWLTHIRQSRPLHWTVFGLLLVTNILSTRIGKLSVWLLGLSAFVLFLFILVTSQPKQEIYEPKGVRIGKYLVLAAVLVFLAWYAAMAFGLLD